MDRLASIDDLTDDARFEVIRKLDYTSIDNLCNSNRLFRRFCVSFEGDIYRYLLQRDYGVDSARDVSRGRYLQARNVQTLTLQRLRESGISIFADMLELECLVNPTGRIHQLFTSLANQVIIAPTDVVIQEYIKSVIYLSEDDFYERFSTLLLQNHVGAFLPDQRFSNLNGLTFIVTTPNNPLILLGDAVTIRLCSTNQVILSQEQHNSIFAFFEEQRNYDAGAIWP